MDRLIVICTNNGQDHLDRLLGSFVEFGTKTPALIVDTGSSDFDYTVSTVENYKSSLDLSITQRDGGRTTGAYLLAYKNFPADHYMFMQDSMRVKQEGWLEEFHTNLYQIVGPWPTGYVPWLSFKMHFTDIPMRDWVVARFGTAGCPSGVFGPVFYTSKKVLDKIKELRLLPKVPTEKWQECGNERAWALAFHGARYIQNPINKEYYVHDDQLNLDTMRLLTKYLVDRRG